MFCVMCAIDIFLNKIMKSKFCVKKCQENVLQFMFLYIIRTPLLELKSVGKKCGLYTGKDGIGELKSQDGTMAITDEQIADTFNKHYH